jgi:ABC-type multidrug transport system fused ATPase/permease subunit
MKKLLRLIRRLRLILDKPTQLKFGGAMIASIVLALLDTVAVLLMLPLVDLATGVPPTTGLEIGLKHLFGDPPIKHLVIYVALLTISLFIIKDIGALLFNWWQGGFQGRNQVKTSTQIMQGYLASPYTEISRRSSAELLRTMNDAVGRTYSNVIGGLLQIAVQGLTMVGIAVALFVTAPVPALALVAFLGIGALVYLRIMKPRARRAGRAAAEASRAAYRAAFAALGGIKETQVRGSEAVFESRYREASEQSIRPNQMAGFIGSAPKFFMEILFIIAVGVLLATTVATKAEGPSGGTVVGLLATFVAGGFRALPSVAALIASIAMLRVGLPYLDLVEAEFKNMKVRSGSQLHREIARPMPFSREITINDVHFSYPDAARPALDGVTVTLPYGQSLALAGSSGAGKTTLVDTLLGLHSPLQGRITVDGVDIEHDKRGWQANIGYVPQEVFMLDATLAENIAFDQKHDQVDTERLNDAIAHAQLEDVVAGLPNGIDTYIGERGSRLSGGQRQRVGIARALYRNPSILVLDEATSALDNETEHRITEAISGLRGTVTVVIVAHRLSTARHADQLAFMQDGKIVTIGTFEEVRDSNPDFAHLVALGALA